MPAFVFTTIDHAVKHLNVKPDATWCVTFINNQTRIGRITEVRHGSYLMEESNGDLFYFDGRKVLFMQPNLASDSSDRHT